MGLAISFLILIGCIIWAFKSSNDLYANFTWVDHTYKVIEDIKDIDICYLQAESNARAYYVTKDKRFFQEFKRAIINLKEEILRVEQSTSNSSIQKKNLESLNLLIEKRIKIFEIILNSTPQTNQWTSNITEEVIIIKLQLKKITNKIINEERRLLAYRQNTAYLNLINSKYIIVYSGLVALTILIIVILYLRKDLKIRKQVEGDLRNLNENKNKFFSIVSHDLRSPVRGIASLSKMLINHKETIDLDESLFVLNKSAEKTANLLDNLLTWARSQMNKIEFNPEYFNLNDLIQDNIISIVNFAAEKGIDLKYNLKEDFFVYADKKMMDYITRNLMWNALKYTNKGGTVEISLEIRNNKTIFSIKDNGIGMPTSVLSKIFSLIKIESRKGTANEEGTGLGLLLSKEFIDKNAGSIWAKSIEGTGSTFFYSLSTVFMSSPEKAKQIKHFSNIQ